MKKNHL